MTAALKMAAPGELCAQSKKLMAFCQTTARSIKAMRQHIGVTHERMDQLLRDMLAQRLIWRQSNGMYKTCTNKLHFIDEQPQAANSLLALADDVEQAQYDADLGNQWDAACTAADGELAAAEASTLEQMASEQIESDVLEQADITELDLELISERPNWELNASAIASEFELKPFDLAVMAAEFEAEQERQDEHIVDNIAAKQRALNYCQMLLSPKSTELRRCLDELLMDLAVIRLQQERA
ncbi:hypothetical protein ACO1PK_00905 [Alishewanella sp. d11]|uniref:hypothetical protein n=1 Tax=Alishewanella sp. d11 TaxID=3414030 RepID=UPI003BF86641